MNVKRTIVLTTLVLLILFLIALSFVPRVTASVQETVDRISDEAYKALNQAYQKLQEDNSLWMIFPEESIRTVTVRNLWSKCDYYILPCYLLDVCDVPRAGSPEWRASVHILTACSNPSSLVARLCSLELSEFSLEMKPGINTFVYSYADILPVNLRVDDPYNVVMRQSVDCLREPRVTVCYTVATDSSAEQRDEQAEVCFDWYYSIYCCGKPLCGYHQSVCREYAVNT